MRDHRDVVLDCIREIRFRDYDVPKERFVEYEPSDLDWMVYFGLAKKKIRPDFVAINSKIKRSFSDGSVTFDLRSIPIVVSDLVPKDTFVLVNTKDHPIDKVDASSMTIEYLTQKFIASIPIPKSLLRNDIG